MPISIPTFMAVQFVAQKSLKQRISVLQRSYQIQSAGMATFTLLNADKFPFIKTVSKILVVT